MQQLRIITLLALICVITLSCSKDDGNTETRIPTQVLITSIDVTDYPETKPDDSSWDINSGRPDLKIKVYDSSTLIDDSGVIYQDASPNDNNRFLYSGVDIGIESLTVIELIDGDLTSDDVMGRVSRIFYISGEDTEDSVEISEDGISMTVGLRYVF